MPFHAVRPMIDSRETSDATGSEAPRVLGLFAKWPEPGQVKTRLAAARSLEWAAQVAEAFLRDQVERLFTINATRVLVFTPAVARHHFNDLVGDRFELLPQSAGDLGRRMAAFFAGQLQAGAERIVLVGTDSPTLPLEFIERAFDELATADVVLGPASDGGYYLIGCARRLPPVFESVPWGMPQVLSETVARLDPSAGRLALLPPWYDVDTPADWDMLCGHLRAMYRAGIDPGLPHIWRLVTGLSRSC